MKNQVFIVILLLVIMITPTSYGQALSLQAPEQKALAFASYSSVDELTRFASTRLSRYALLDGGLLAGADPVDQRTLASVDRNPMIEDMIEQVTQSQVNLYDRQLAGELPVWTGSSWYTIPTRYTYSGIPIQMTTQYAGQHLQNLGLKVTNHAWNNITNPNVIGEITGLTLPGNIFIIGAHIDDTNGTPGADDNASGSVASLLAAEILSQYQWGCSLRFAFWTGEEQGLDGSESYALRASKMGENILGYLNLDMIAWNSPGSDPYINLIYSNGLPKTYDLALLFADVIDAYDINLLTRFGIGSTNSDHYSFWQYGYTSILAIEDRIGGDFNPQYHKVGDTPANNDLVYFTNFVKASIATFAHMSECLIPPGWLNGHITQTSNGEPLQDVTVIATHDDEIIQSITDPSGYYTMTLPIGSYSVVASSNGYIPQAVNAVISSGEATTLDFALIPGCEPVAQPNIAWQPPYIVAGEPITFTATASGTPLIDFQWNFGDNQTGTGNVISHTYSQPGDYDLSLSATNGCGEVSLGRTITAIGACDPLMNLDFTWSPLYPVEGDLITFAASVSGTEPAEFQWDFGHDVTAVGKNVTYTYEDAGSYPVDLLANNACSTSTILSKDVTVMHLILKSYLPVVVNN